MLWCLRAGTGPWLRSVMGGLAIAGVMSASPAAMAASSGRIVEYNGYMDYARALRAARSGASIRIRNSPGGQGASAHALSRARRVIVDGACNSACAWAFVANKNTCFTANARFVFHGVQDPGLGTPLPLATNYWLAKTRGSLRTRVSAVKRRGKLVPISAGEMRRHYPERVCH